MAELVRRKIFIAGCGRSGTTLASKLMRCFSETYVDPGENRPERLFEIQDRARVCVAKRMWNSFRDIPRLPDDIDLIYCVRHPYDVLTSRHPKTADRREFHIDIRRWLNEVGGLRRLRKKQPDREIFYWRYEDLLAAPDTLQDALARRFGLEPLARFSEQGIHANSLRKWESNDRLRDYLGTLPASALPSMQQFATEFGYDCPLHPPGRRRLLFGDVKRPVASPGGISSSLRGGIFGKR